MSSLQSQIQKRAPSKFDPLLWLGLSLMFYFVGSLAGLMIGVPVVGWVGGSIFAIYALYRAIRDRRFVQAAMAVVLLAVTGYVGYVAFWVMRNWPNF